MSDSENSQGAENHIHGIFDRADLGFLRSCGGCRYRRLDLFEIDGRARSDFVQRIHCLMREAVSK